MIRLDTPVDANVDASDFASVMRRAVARGLPNSHWLFVVTYGNAETRILPAESREGAMLHALPIIDAEGRIVRAEHAAPMARGRTFTLSGVAPQGRGR
jgi:hypothetical protein